MLDPFRNYDVWKKASPYDDIPEPMCSSCGAHLPEEPLQEIEEIIVTTCYGRKCPDVKDPNVLNAYKIPKHDVWVWTIRCVETRYLWCCEKCGEEFLE